MRTIRGIPAVYKSAWGTEPEEFTAEVNFVPEVGALQFMLPGGSSVALSYEYLADFVKALEER